MRHIVVFLLLLSLLPACNTKDGQKASSMPNLEHLDAQVNELAVEAIVQKNIRSPKVVSQQVHIYDSLSVVSLYSAEAHFLYGISLMTKENSSEACEQFIHSLVQIDQLRADSASNTVKAAIYERLGMLYFFDAAWETSLDCMLKALYGMPESFYYERAKIYRTIGNINNNRAVFDSVFMYYEIADSINNLADGDNSFLTRDIQKYKAIFNFHHNQKNLAYQQIYDLVYNTPKPNELKLYSEVLGDFYYQDNQYDSALLYYEQSIPLFTIQTLDVYNKIISICDSLNYTDKVSYYASKLAELSTKDVQRAGEKTEIVSLYEQYKAQRQHDLMVIHTRQLTHRIVLVALVVIAVLVLTILIIRKAHKKSAAQNEWYINTLQGKVKKATAESKEKENTIRSLQTELDMVRLQQSDLSFDDRIKQLQEMPICQTIIKRLDGVTLKTTSTYPDLQLSSSQQDQLIGAVDTVFDCFSLKLANRYPRLTSSDILYCCFYLMGLDEKQAAALTGKTYQAVWTRSGKMQAIFQTKADLRHVLRDMVQ